MGIVYRGVHGIIGKTVAIKVLKPDFADDPDMVQRLVGEARTVNAIRHPGIVDIFGFGSLPSRQPYIVMDLLEGQPLDEYIKQHAPLPLKAVWPILDDLLGALGAAHNVGVIHRDLKPGNVFRESHPEARSRIKVIDFGLARTADRAGGSVRPTNPGTLLGTPAFMAPEQVVGTKVTPATDLYAVGGIAYQLLTGHLPHEAPSAVEVLSQKMQHDPIRPKKWVATLDTEIDDWVMALLAREPDARPQSAEEARRVLRRITEGRTSSSSPSAPVGKRGASGKNASLGAPSGPARPRGWSDAKTVLVDEASPADAPFAPTKETPALRKSGNNPMPHFGPTPLPQAAPGVVPLPLNVPVSSGSGSRVSPDNRTMPMPAVSDADLGPPTTNRSKRELKPVVKVPVVEAAEPEVADEPTLPPRPKPKSLVPLLVGLTLLVLLLGGLALAWLRAKPV